MYVGIYVCLNEEAINSTSICAQAEGREGGDDIDCVLSRYHFDVVRDCLRVLRSKMNYRNHLRGNFLWDYL